MQEKALIDSVPLTSIPPSRERRISRLTDERSHRGEGCRFASLVERSSFGGIDAGRSAYRRRPPSPQSSPSRERRISRPTHERSRRGEAQGCRFASLIERPSFGGIAAGRWDYRRRPPSPQSSPARERRISRLTDERSHRGEAQGCRFASLVERSSFGGIDAGRSAYRRRSPHLNPLPQGRGRSLGPPMNAAGIQPTTTTAGKVG